MIYLHGTQAKPGDLLVWSAFGHETSSKRAGAYAGVAVRMKIPPGGNRPALMFLNEKGGYQHLNPVYVEVVRAAALTNT